ncbi:MAG TPA: LTA synthase family protein [Clostridiales bacterium]|nr:LTA synthase family protein [Clostridiales bacterium]
MRGKEFVEKVSARVRADWDYIDKERRNNLLIPLVFFTGTLIYLEVISHLIIYSMIDSKIILPVLFALPVGAFFSLLVGFFSPRVNKRLIFLLTGLICFYYGLQVTYFSLFKMHFSFQTLGMAGDAVSEFGSDVVNAIKDNISELIIVAMPLLLLIVLIEQGLELIKRKHKEQGILGAAILLLHCIALLAILPFGKGDYSPYDIYYNTRVHEFTAEQLGIATMTRFDLVRLISPRDEMVLANAPTIDWKVPTVIPTQIPIKDYNKPDNKPSTKANAKPTAIPSPTPIPIDRSPNIMDIDFLTLAESENDDVIRTMHEYFAQAAPTNKNEYTGMFQGYNLIMITAEGYSPYAVHKELTPTLYKLTNEGFVFNNFYTALWQTSTSDGEYVAMTGLVPVGTRSMYRARNNYMPFSLGQQFNRLGIDSKAYHNHTYTYYQRDETHSNLGYDFIAKGNGLKLKSDVWPGSDIEMMEDTVHRFIEDEQFHVYYLTVSGHMNYTFVGNSMSFKNRDLVKDLPYSSEGRAYIACQIELDRALEYLIKELEEAGVLENTVIALSADHYPYGWEKSQLDELAGHEIEADFETYKNNFILWNSGMKEDIIIDKPCSSLDILPTLSNLFGLEYDSRLLMGKDILSDGPALVILSDRSFITDKLMYISGTGEIIKLTNEELPKGYIKGINSIIKNKFTISDNILRKDYYSYVFDNRY